MSFIQKFLFSKTVNTSTVNEHTFQSHLNKAVKLCEWGAYREAIPMFSHCIDLFPDRHFVLFQMAEAYAALEEKDSALIWYRRCLERDPSDPFGVTIKLVLAGEMAMPDTLPEKYVERPFDVCALFLIQPHGRLSQYIPIDENICGLRPKRYHRLQLSEY